MHLLMFAQATLRQPPYNKKKQWFHSSTFVTSNLKKWRDEGVAWVWKDVVKAYSKPTSMSNICKGEHGNITRALSLAHEGVIMVKL